MADNIDVTPGTGKTIAADDITGVLHQRVKISQGVDGSATDVSATDPLNVTLANTGANATAIKVDGSAVTQPVSGTVTANAGSGTMAVSAASLPLPSGAATSANQSTANTSLNNIDVNAGATTDAAATAGGTGTVSAKLRRISTDIDAVKTSVSSIDGKVTAANTGAVTISAALPSGTNAIGKLSANSGVDIGDVDVTSVTPGTTATALGKAEDAAHTTGDVGVMALGVRNDNMADLTGTDGDYGAIAVTSSGRVQTTRTAHANMVRGNATVTTTSDTSLIAAGGVGIKNYVTAVQVANSSSTNCVITIKDGSGGSTLGYIAAPANGGAIVYYDIPLVSSSNTAIFFASNNAATTIFVSAQGYRGV